MLGWLSTDDARFILILGSFGHGKTFLSHQLALGLPDRLPHVDPMVIEIGALEKSFDLDRLVAQHLVDAGVRQPDLDAFRYMVREGRIALIFDSFGELAARITYARATAYLDGLLAILDGTGKITDDGTAGPSRAKVVVTSRAEFFVDDKEVLTKTGEKVERTLGRFIARLEDFTPAQIERYLVGHFTRALLAHRPPLAAQAEARQLAASRLALVREVRDLPDLARNPRLLSFIVEIDDELLRAVRDRAANSGDGRVTAAELSDLMLDFLVDLADREQLAAWVRSTADDPDAPGTVRENALLVARRLSIALRTGAALAGTDLSGRDLRDADLRDADLTDARLDGADLRGATLAGASLRGTRVSGADLREATLTGATLVEVVAEKITAGGAALDGSHITGGRLDDLVLAGASLRGARLAGMVLTRADLTDADLSGATLTNVTLADTGVGGSRWSRAAVLGGSLGSAADAPELIAAAIAGRDSAQLMTSPAPAQQYSVAFSPDGTLLATASDDRTAQLWGHHQRPSGCLRRRAERGMGGAATRRRLQAGRRVEGTILVGHQECSLRAG